jgi:pSer/pThr/pTyr-binding forkhead associated (FHA) protein
MDSPEVVLHLLDGSQGFPVQTWKFKGQKAIRIGRAEDNDIIIRQPMVSRLHAVLKWGGERWVLVGESRFGTLIGDLPITESELTEGDRFQLGAMGPVLSMQSSLAESAHSSTVRLTTMSAHEFSNEKKTAQVEAIASSDYFKNLQKMAKNLKAAESKAQ